MPGLAQTPQSSPFPSSAVKSQTEGSNFHPHNPSIVISQLKKGHSISSFFCRFKDETLRILESVLVFKDLKSMIETRSDLKQSMRSESFSIIHQIKIKLPNRSFSLSNYVLALSLSQAILRQPQTPCQILSVN
jgi:hypothetical protein